MVGTSQGGLTRAFVERGGGVYTAFFLTRDLGTVVSWSNPAARRARDLDRKRSRSPRCRVLARDAARAAHLSASARAAHLRALTTMAAGSPMGLSSDSGWTLTTAAGSARRASPAPRRWSRNPLEGPPCHDS